MDDRGKRHVRQDIFFEIHARGDLDQRHAGRGEFENTALGNIAHGLALFTGIVPAEGDMLDLRHEFVGFTFLGDLQGAILDGGFESAGREGARKDDFLGVLADVDEAARAGQAGAEFADIKVALPVGLGQTQKGDVQAAAVIEIKLRGLVDHRLGVDGRTEIESAGRKPPDDAGLGRQGHGVEDALFIGHDRNAFGHADAQVDDAVGAQLEDRSAGDDLAGPHGGRLDGLDRYPVLTGIGRVVDFGKGLPVMLRLGDHHAVHQDAGDLDLAGVEGAGLGQALHLDNDETAAVAGGGGDGQRLEGQGLLFHGHIAVGIGGGAAQDGHIDGQGFVGQVFLAVEADQLDDIGRGPVVDLAAPVAGVDEGAQPNGADGARFVGGDVAVHM